MHTDLARISFYDYEFEWDKYLENDVEEGLFERQLLSLTNEDDEEDLYNI